MDMYKIKVKRVERPAFSSIVAWLDNGYYQVGSEDSRLLTLAYISDDAALKAKIELSDQGPEKVIEALIREFRKDYSEVIQNLLKVTTLEKANEMIQLIETFIRVCVIKNEINLLKNQN